MSYQADLTDEARTKEVAREVTAAYDIVGLVNNAGATRPGTADTATLEDLDYVVNLHLRTALILAQAALPAMRAAGFGRIVNMSSRAALGKPDRVVYSATKAGLVGLTRTLAMELGGDGITVNAIGPGPIATDLFTKSNPAGAPQTERIINSIVVKRLGTPEDVARAAMFFLSPDNGFVTGQMLRVRRHHAGRGADLNPVMMPAAFRSPSRPRRLRSSAWLIWSAAQRRQEGFQHRFARVAVGVAADVHRRDHAAAAVDDGHGHRLQPRLQLLRHAGVAVGAHPVQQAPEFHHVGDGVRRVGLDLAHGQHAVALGRGRPAARGPWT